MEKLVVANWKMNPQSEREAVRLAKASDFSGVVIAPPFVFLDAVGKILKKAELGAQDIFAPLKKSKKHTGEISPEMLKNLGVKYVILGHSERRALGETDAIVNREVLAALRAGLKVVLCVGENLSIRKRGIAAAKNFVKSQLKKDLKWLGKSLIIVSYEPIWAIGTGKNDSPKDAAEMAKFIKTVLTCKVLYGGSITSENISGFLKFKEIDGFLVGGASLKISEFSRIIKKTK